MASLWEILDVSNLEYNSTLGYGYTSADSGSGPPNYELGWVRTGYITSTVATPGQANCNVWTDSGILTNGTAMRLPYNWTLAAEVPAPWVTGILPCNTDTRVWCVED